MSGNNILTEAPPLTEQDSFVIFERHKSYFNFPIHKHDQFELNYIENAANAQRVVGDHVAEISDLELVLIGGSNLEHGWTNHKCKSKDIYEITIQFNTDFFTGGMFSKKQFIFLRKMLTDATNGLLFSKETTLKVKPLIYEMTKAKDGFTATMLFVRIIYELSLAEDTTILSHQKFSKGTNDYDSRRVRLIMNYLSEHYKEHIRLSDAASLVNMSETSFSRFIKIRTGKTFVDCLNDIRISAAARLLIDEPTNIIADIAYKSGFNNISNFNRIFKKKKGMTPQDFRECYIKKHMII